MSVDKPAPSPALSDTTPSNSSAPNKRWSGAGFLSSSGGGVNAGIVELGDFEDIDLGRDNDPGDGDTTPKMKRNQGDVMGLGILRSRSPFESAESGKFWRKTSPRRTSLGLGLGPNGNSPTKGTASEGSRPTSKRGSTASIPITFEGAANGHPARKVSRHRRTSSEIERVYDSDDSVPPETVFYNVPVSPSR